MLLTFMWMGVVAVMFTIIAAAMKAQDNNVCKGYKVNIRGWKDSVLFTSENQVVALLKAATKGEVKGQKLAEFNLPRMEELLEQSSWVYNAQLYFDNRGILNVNVTERKPLARIFTSNGKSFYIDEAGKHIPLSDKISLDVPVFTGYPDKYKMNAADSSLLQNMIATASFINGDPFWEAQVSQIDISACGEDCWNMEMIPVVGNHKVALGDGSDIASKFHRLYLFYDQVLKRTGFDKYQKIDVQYNGQVVGVKGKYTKIDSLQLRRNIENMLVQSRESNELIEESAAMAAAPYKIDTTGSAMYRSADNDADTTEIAAIGMPENKPGPVVKEAPEEETNPAPVKTDPAKKQVSHTGQNIVAGAAVLGAAAVIKHKVAQHKTVAVADKKQDTKAEPAKHKAVKETVKHEKKTVAPVKKQEVKKTGSAKHEVKKETAHVAKVQDKHAAAKKPEKAAEKKKHETVTKPAHAAGSKTPEKKHTGSKTEKPPVKKAAAKKTTKKTN